MPMSHLQVAMRSYFFASGHFSSCSLKIYHLISARAEISGHLIRGTEKVPAQVKTQPGVKVPAHLAQTGLVLSGNINAIKF